MNQEPLSLWHQTALVGIENIWGKIAAFIPNFLAAIIVLVVGYIIAKIAGKLFTALLLKLHIDDAANKMGVSNILAKANISNATSSILGEILFWLIMLTFVVSASESLGLERVSAIINGFVSYIPKVFGAIVVLFIGLFIAQFARRTVLATLDGMDLDYAKALASLVHGILLVITVTLAIGQLDIETGLLTAIISILLAAVGVALALALGLGTRELTSEVVAGMYVRDLFKVGDHITMGEISGVLVQVGAVKSMIQDNGVEISISNSELLHSVVLKTVPTEDHSIHLNEE